MKRNKYHIIQSWILMICFVAGQYMVYAHQHMLIQGTKHTHSISKQQSQQTISEKCQLCDAMHHYSMDVSSHPGFNSFAVADCVYISPVYNFTSLALILSGGRAPPSVTCPV